MDSDDTVSIRYGSVSDRMVRRSNPASGYPLADDPHIATDSNKAS